MNKFKQAPLELKIFALLSLIITVGHFLALAIFLKKYLAIQPYIGSNSFVPYIFGLLVPFNKRKEMNFEMDKLRASLFFGLFMLFGLGEIYFYEHLVLNVPFEKVMIYRIIIVFVIPCLWILWFMHKDLYRIYTENRLGIKK